MSIDIIKSHFIPAALALIAVFAAVPFIESSVRIYRSHEPAITWYSARVNNQGNVKPGDALSITYRARINKQCPSDLRGFLVFEDDQTVPVRYPTLSGGYAKPSKNVTEINVKVPIPVSSDAGLLPMKSGEYIYRTIVTRYCPEGVEEDTKVPDAHFHLEVE